MNDIGIAKEAIDALTGKTIDITFKNLGDMSLLQCIEKLKEIKKDLVDRFDMNPNKYFFNLTDDVKEVGSRRERISITFYRQDLFCRKFYNSELDDFKPIREKRKKNKKEDPKFIYFRPTEWAIADMSNNSFESIIDFEKMQNDLKRYFRRKNFYKKTNNLRNLKV